jgi:acetyl-CoA carboxylase carboxyltransferase component
VLPADHRMPYEFENVLLRILDAADYCEFQPEYASEMLCANARLEGSPMPVIANRRGFLKAQGRPRIGGIIYAESARKVAHFVEAAERLGTPLV